MRRPHAALIAAGVITAFVFVAPTTGTNTAGAATAARSAAMVADALQISSDSGDRVEGSFARGASTVTFEGRRLSPVSAAATMTVNGKKITATRDLKAGTASWSGAGATLVPEDRQVLLALVKSLDRSWVEPTRDRQEALGGHRDLVLRLAMLLGEAPLGVRLEPQDTPRPGERTLDKTFEMTGVSSAAESCLADVIATTTAGTAERQAGVAACQQSNEDGILYFANCDTYGRWICHDADSHCFMCETVNAGPRSDGCLGECGSGCDGLDIYTYDCGDHDRCGRVHGGSTNPWDSECGDEYWEADDDFMWGWPNC